MRTPCARYRVSEMVCVPPEVSTSSKSLVTGSAFAAEAAQRTKASPQRALRQEFARRMRVFPPELDFALRQPPLYNGPRENERINRPGRDRKSTRLNSS